MIRSLGIFTIGVMLTACFSLYAVLLALISPGEEKIHQVARIWARVLLRLAGVKVHVIGRENILQNEPRIFMANHQSDFDIFTVLGHIPGEFRWIAKEDLFRIPVFGRAMRAAGYIPIDRGNHEKAMDSIVKAAGKIRENRSVMSFPEGTRSLDGTIGSFKPGMFHLAMQAQVPIVPITIIGANAVWPKRTLNIKRGTITIVIDKPIDVAKYTPERRNELIEKVRNIILLNLETYSADSRLSSIKAGLPQ
ncbi:MAG: 1-acyl-sn-glycerol-3-phosphate acyltransferase [Syntrophaceae bacterium]|nr:1-acyl-sn-glycerol-3-phosphate acyltransferase [Syntrophaceae bacterium]